ncbi:MULTISPECIES: ATP-grasp domain-containing protein [Nostocales]|uniref:ATP-grasp domain-containing protein n=3 Tax=Nostocales TaxID=1161 RepID=A0A0C1R5M0_9CYAN|nr:ATP-grasp domain-containing protein [Tolypothrix bouteillei]KAF3888840.1 ATP-grasp domain-containing protein [Tolypothrix bouteillei VB521301]
MISKAFIQEQGNGRLRHEEQLVTEELRERGIPITFYTEKRIRRRQLPLDRESLVVGDIPCVLGALKQVGIPEPQPNDYPTSLINFMHRRTWISTLEQLEVGFRNGVYPPTFVKPATRRKRFTGFILESEYDFWQVYGVSRQEKLLCSEVVSWVSEYRVYVVRSQIRSCDCYRGNADVPLDTEKVLCAIQALDSAGESHAGYAIDFGVLASGKTALVEMNDGFALGAYTIDRQNYTDMILARWEELIK